MASILATCFSNYDTVCCFYISGGLIGDSIILLELNLLQKQEHSFTVGVAGFWRTKRYRCFKEGECVPLHVPS